MSDGPAVPATVHAPIRVLPDGTVSLNQNILDGIVAMVASNCEYYAGDSSGKVVGAVLATCAGYVLGRTMENRNDVSPVSATLAKCMEQGMGDGMDDNKGLPRLNG